MKGRRMLLAEAHQVAVNLPRRALSALLLTLHQARCTPSGLWRAVVLNELEQELCYQGSWWLSPAPLSEAFSIPLFLCQEKSQTPTPQIAVQVSRAHPEFLGLHLVFSAPGKCYLSQLSLKFSFVACLHLLAYVLQRSRASAIFYQIPGTFGWPGHMAAFFGKAERFTIMP